MKVNIGKQSIKIYTEDNMGAIGEENMLESCYIENVLLLNLKDSTCKCKRINDSFGNTIGIEILPREVVKSST